MSQYLHGLLRSWLWNLQAPKPSSKAACSCSLHVLQVFPNYSRSSGALELAHITGWRTLAGKQTWSRIRGLHHPLPFVSVPFTPHKRVQETKSCHGFQRHLKAFDPDEEEQQQRGDDGGGTTTDGAGFHRVRRRHSQSKESMLRGICISILQNKSV